jgi:chromosome partitioning protein
MSTRIVTLAMKKGGVGKTTSAVSLATIAALRGVDVGLIDLDSQGSGTNAFGQPPSDRAAEVLLGRRSITDAWVPTESGVRLIPSGPGTAGAERQLAADPIAGLTALRSAMHAADDLPELVIIDTRPDEAHGLLNALVASTEVWATVEPVPASLEVLPRLLETVDRIAAGLNPGLSVSAIIPTRFDARTRTHLGCLAALRQTFPGITTHPVPASVKAVEAHGARTPLPIYASLSAAAIAYVHVAGQLHIHAVVPA